MWLIEDTSSNSFLNGIQPHDWMSNEQSDFSSSKAAALQAEWPTIQTLLTAPAPPTSPSIKRPQTKGDTLFNLRTFTEQFKFPLKRLLEWPVGTGLNRVIFLFMHPQNEKEFEPVISALHSLDLEVYSLARPGSWRWFSNHYRSGVIIVSIEHRPAVSHAESTRSKRNTSGKSVRYPTSGIFLREASISGNSAQAL